MRLTRESGADTEAHSPSILQVIDALIMFDSPLLDHRFKEAVMMHPDAAVRASLAAVPARVAEGARLTRRAAVEWERAVAGDSMPVAVQRRAERCLLEALVDTAEAQIRLKAFLSRQAPTAESRRLIDHAIAIHCELTALLREAACKLEAAVQGGGAPGVGYVGLEDERGELRGRVEGAICRMSESGNRARTLVLSPNALRHLRDQGLFQEGATDVLGVPVQVELTWPGSTFALMSFDSIPLAEISKSV